MKTTVYVWDTYPSDEVTATELELPVRSDGTPFPPAQTIKLLDALHSATIKQDPGECPKVAERGDGTFVLTADFGRLSYSFYWHPADPALASKHAETDLAAHLQLLDAEEPI